MRFGSVCSGIEAASVAWKPLGWEPAWFSEIEPFPCAVLAHHFPGVPNLGDMRTIPERILSGEVEAPDLLCGGTPCQAFSIAGLRGSLSDDRGNLSLVFVEIADAIDAVRTAAGLPPAIIFWENVPGVLSVGDNAFGCLLGAIAGEKVPLEIPGGKWGGAGLVHGGRRKIAWRILDAQYFGIPQRRRRVYVVASSRDNFNPSKVLFEYDSVPGNSAQSGSQGKEIASDIDEGVAGNCQCLGNGSRVTNALTSHDLEQQVTSQTGGGTLVVTNYKPNDRIIGTLTSTDLVKITNNQMAVDGLWVIE